MAFRSSTTVEVLGRSGDSLFFGAKRAKKRSPKAISSSLRDHYNTLSVKPGASQNEVKKAYRQLALKYHPDVCKGGNSKAMFQRINEAYNIVINGFRSGADTLSEASRMSGYESEEYAEEMESYYDDVEVEDWMGWEGAGCGVRNYASAYCEWP